MIVLKFGGTSVGSAQKIKDVANLITQNTDEKKLVVLSAMSGTTNMLEQISSLLLKQEIKQAKVLIDDLRKKYKQVTTELFENETFSNKAMKLIGAHFDYILSLAAKSFNIWDEKNVMAQGELISTALLNMYIQSTGKQSVLLPALNFMRIDKNAEPDEFYIRQNLERELEKYPNEPLFITQGYICRDAFGEIDNLKRGGSDYTASLIGAAVDAREIQIWTDIDGFHNNDPRFVENTKAISELSFDEAAELAYFGAKIMHPSSIQPAQKANIPVRLKNTMNPNEKGTLITATEVGGQIKAVAAKDNITAIKIKSSRMLMAYGFIRKIFEVFERYRTPIDMIATSEIAVSVTIDNPQYLEEIKAELANYGSVEIDKHQAIVCVVGNLIAEDKGVALSILQALKDVPIRMISYGGSRHNISFLVQQSDKIFALNQLSNHFFNNKNSGGQA